MGLGLQAHDLDQLIDPRPGDARGHAVELGEHPQALAHREDAVTARFAAGDQPNATPNLLSLADHVEAHHPGGAVGGVEQRREDLDEGGLAGAVGPQQAEGLAALDLDVHSGQGLHTAPAPGGAKDPRQALHDDRWVGGDLSLHHRRRKLGKRRVACQSRGGC
ncbi:MAG TPA: hypothetical protein VGK93_06180 [Candidatus Eisenbacteria bacterium]|jgi:hypothetical protein